MAWSSNPKAGFLKTLRAKIAVPDKENPTICASNGEAGGVLLRPNVYLGGEKSTNS
jgi:hypothetical protein